MSIIKDNIAFILTQNNTFRHFLKLSTVPISNIGHCHNVALVSEELFLMFQ